MEGYGFSKGKINKWLIAIICSVSVFVLMAAFMLSEIQKNQKTHELAIAKTYSAFQSEAVSLIYDNIVLLKGYLTLIETSQIDWDMSEIYLNRLFAMNENYIRNITIIEDTTIKWVYPMIGNEEAIGVDLSQVTGQKDIIKKVKEYRLMILDGPIELVQGGKGFIARIPIVLIDGSYWGQMSIVLDAAKLENRLMEIAEAKGLAIHIESVNNDTIVLNNSEVKKNNPMIYDIHEKNFSWKVYAAPLDGWNDNVFRILVIIAFSIGVAIGVGFAVVYAIQNNEELQEQATKDALTGLYNRHFLEDYIALVLSRADRYGKKVGFILIDLNKFKQINDTYGHKFGDQVLQIASDILIEQTRYNEASFRLGGDEFLIVLPDVATIDEIEAVEKRIQKVFSEKFLISGISIQIILSIGTSVYPDNGSNYDEVMQVADEKMYNNKYSKLSERNK